MWLRSLWTLICLFMLVTCARSQNYDVQLVGAGTSMPVEINAVWFQEFEKVHPTIHLHYMPFGSGEGTDFLRSGKVDFAGTDVPMTSAQLSKAGLLQLPTVLGAVVPAYNLPGVSVPLRFSPQVLAGIYLGTIKHWNDPAISRLNPDADLPASEIIVFHSTQGRGSAYVWSDFLSKVSEEWRRKIGAGASVTWPTGHSAEGTGNLAQLVKQTPNSIGYVWLAYALRNRLAYGRVQNSAGNFVTADAASVAAAASATARTMPSNFCVSITNASGERAYPIASFTWLLVPQRAETAEKQRALRQFMGWVLSSGQEYAEGAGLVRLPAEVVSKELTVLNKME